MAGKKSGKNNDWMVIGIILLAVGFSGKGHVPQIDEILGSAGKINLPIPSQIANNTTAPDPGSSAKTSNGDIAAARRQLSTIKTVPSRTAVSNYSRSQFGPAWTDDNTALGGHNGCDTRNDILKSSLTNVVFQSGSRCVVQSGILPFDPYTGKKNVTWTRGASTSSALQVDHVVPLQWAWDNGASKWPLEKRVDYANDQATVLLLADGPQNGAKGAKGPSQWFVPANPSYRCAYAVKFTSIVDEYGLTMPAADAAALKSQLEKC